MMSYQALCENGGIISIGDYTVLPHGSKPIVRCLSCLSVLGEKANYSDKSTHFAHPRGAGANCPDSRRVLTNIIQFELPNGTKTRAKRNELRNEFRETWVSHYMYFKRNIAELRGSEFVSIVREANEKDIWAYVDLDVNSLVYSMTALHDFNAFDGFSQRSHHTIFRYLPPHGQDWNGFWLWRREALFRRDIQVVHDSKEILIGKNIKSEWSKVNQDFNASSNPPDLTKSNYVNAEITRMIAGW